MLEVYQKRFIELAITEKALSFGEFELKSGRVSPYFFNAGLFHSGRALSILGQSYAQVIAEANFNADVIFGPAYKGIPLAACTVAALSERFDIDLGYAYNRKERKAHGEGGVLVGADLQGKRVVILDDVITAGTAIREVIAIISAAGGIVSGVVIGLNRQEKGQNGYSAIDEIEESFNIPVMSIINLEQIVDFLEGSQDLQAWREKVLNYRELYGV